MKEDPSTRMDKLDKNGGGDHGRPFRLTLLRANIWDNSAKK